MLKYILSKVRMVAVFMMECGSNTSRNTNGIYNQSTIIDDYILAKSKGLK
jgi:hypothetical protein